MHGLIRVLKEHDLWSSYIISFVISVEVTQVFLELGFFQNLNPQDTRYFLSALAQVEGGAIISIYITMMLVGIQLTLKEYSEVVLDVYSKNCEFCLVFISYVASIVFTLILLQNAENIATLWIRLAYLWGGTFNLLIVPLFIYNLYIIPLSSLIQENSLTDF